MRYLSLADVLLITITVAVLWLPGGLLGAVSGLRGWTLAAAAPLLTYTLAGVTGPYLSVVGIPWTPTSSATATVFVIGLIWVLRRLAGRANGPPAAAPRHQSHWSPMSHTIVGACTVAAAALGVGTILTGIRSLSAIPQDWDAAFHANGIRYIAETDRGDLFALAEVNWYEIDGGIFYPNAYHLVSATIYELTGSHLPAVLNANTVLIPGLLSLSLVAMVHRMGASPALAAAAALLAVTPTAFYDILWRGPLLPFAIGAATVPVAVTLAIDYVDATERSSRIASGGLLIAAIAGLLCLHPGTVFSAAVLGFALLAQRWFRSPRRLLPESTALVVVACFGALLCYRQVIGSARSAGDTTDFDWAAELSPSHAIGTLIAFDHGSTFPQWWLGLVVIAGIILNRSMGALRWTLSAAAGFGILFVSAASYDTRWSALLTSPWWNDRWRLIALTTIPMVVIGAHGIVQVAVQLSRITLGRRSQSPSILVTSARVSRAAGVLAITGFILATDGLYFARNSERMESNSGEGPALSSSEVAGLHAVGRLVGDGARVLNDRGDGSVWLYALTGTRSVAGHYSDVGAGPDAALLAAAFNTYDRSPAVRAAAQRLDVQFVLVADGFLRPDARRQPGLTDLSAVDALDVVYRNDDIILYTIVGFDQN